jgi:pantoate--beta-alanine ligase
VEVTEISKRQEGEFRPTHFRGVTSIVTILFNSVLPDVAVFGQKDAQQAAVIKRMVNDLKFNIDIVIAPIIREEDGLALSSRNVYLSPQERKDALVLNKSLAAAKDLISQGERNVPAVIEKMNQIINSVSSSNLDYIRIVDSSDFNEVEELLTDKEYYILIACRIGSTRLIDNILIKI